MARWPVWALLLVVPIALTSVDAAGVHQRVARDQRQALTNLLFLPHRATPFLSTGPGRSREPGPETGAYAYVPHTSHVALGRAYPFTLFTPCGLQASLVDFDHGLWDLADGAWVGSNGNPPPGIGNPFQKGAMTLLGAQRARFSFGRAQVSFVRHQGVKYLPLCS